MPLVLQAQPLTRETFKPFGEVIQKDGAANYAINRGATRRFHDLCDVRVKNRGRVLVSLFEAFETVLLPYRVPLLECHPLGSPAFIPCDNAKFLIAVAPPADAPSLAEAQAFLTDGRQGVNYAPGVWHLPLASFSLSTYAVIDRGGAGENLREFELDAGALVIQD